MQNRDIIMEMRILKKRYLLLEMFPTYINLALQTAYQFCSGSRSMFLDLTDCQTIMTCKDNRAMKVRFY